MPTEQVFTISNPIIKHLPTQNSETSTTDIMISQTWFCCTIKYCPWLVLRNCGGLLSLLIVESPIVFLSDMINLWFEFVVCCIGVAAVISSWLPDPISDCRISISVGRSAYIYKQNYIYKQIQNQANNNNKFTLILNTAHSAWNWT